MARYQSVAGLGEAGGGLCAVAGLRDSGGGRNRSSPPRVAAMGALLLAQFESLRGLPTQRILQKPLAASGTQIKPLLAIRIVAHERAFFIELIVAFENLVKVLEVIAIFINPCFVRCRGRVQLHL